MPVFAFPSADVLVIRRYARADAPATLRVFREAVQRGAAEHYSEAKRTAWAPSVIDLAAWMRARAQHPSWVAERRGEVIGFVELTDEGLIAMLYVHPEHARAGVGGALLDEVERSAREADMARLRVHASLVAQPLFMRRGFSVIEDRLVERHGEWLAQAAMEKVLEPGASASPCCPTNSPGRFCPIARRARSSRRCPPASGRTTRSGWRAARAPTRAPRGRVT